MQNFDIVIIGAGPGGYVAAIRAAQLGMKVAIIEREHVGGICLNWGCIPTKALLRSAEVKHLIDHASEFGIKVSKSEIDLDAMVKRSRTISGQLATGIRGLLKKNKVTLFEGAAKIEGNKKVTITLKDGKSENVSANHIILATGARARTLPFISQNHPRVWLAKEAMTPTFMPKDLLIVGSGAIGIEFASFYKTLGANVTVVELLEQILPQEDKEISTLAQKAFEKQGMNFMLAASVTDLKATDTNVTATIKTKDGKVETKTYDAVVVAIGIVGNTENLGLEKTKVKVEKGQIIVDAYCQTAEPGVYAIGDVAGAPWLAHKASHEGILCVEKIANLKTHPMARDCIPGCTYSMPQIASIGLTEAKAIEAKRDIKVGRFPFRGNGKAIALGEPDGLVKTIFDAKTGELIGAHMIGAEVTEMIQGFAIAKTLEATEEELIHTIFPHPTLSEMMHESTLDSLGRVIHY
ncbi:MAG: dihydrolipoyl dehydrogenase [Candidatus Paracaedibacteraceae bacterium]|nr:dihydrolipoyl dehydrogenase [Candidatus Paracaedibacteraceae bacterium]